VARVTADSSEADAGTTSSVEAISNISNVRIRLDFDLIFLPKYSQKQ